MIFKEFFLTNLNCILFRFFKASNRRIFDVYIDGSLLVNDYDIFQQAGSHNKAMIIQRTIDVIHNNGLVIELVSVKENPSISGIEIIPNDGRFNISTTVPSLPPTLAPVAAPDSGQAIIRINAGGDKYIDSLGNIWSADRYVVDFNGQDYTDCFHPITGTIDDSLYCCHRWFAVWTGFPYVYHIPVTMAGVYEVRLHFAEIVRKFTGVHCFRMVQLEYYILTYPCIVDSTLIPSANEFLISS